MTLTGVPFLAAGTAVGKYFHQRVNGRTFAAAVHLTPLATGPLVACSATP